MDFELRAWCPGCGIGVFVASFDPVREGDDGTERVALPTNDAVALPGTCRCGTTLILEVIQSGPTDMEWLLAMGSQAQTLYLAARKAGAGHRGAESAMMAVLAELAETVPSHVTNVGKLSRLAAAAAARVSRWNT